MIFLERICRYERVGGMRIGANDADLFYYPRKAR